MIQDSRNRSHGQDARPHKGKSWAKRWARIALCRVPLHLRDGGGIEGETGEEVIGMGMGLTWIFWVVLIAVLAIAIGWSYSNRRKKKGSSIDAAVDILEQRYAKGEIGKAEFEEKKQELAK
jgi:putative membrane protein